MQRLVALGLSAHFGYPAAVLAPTTHTPSPEDAAALSAYYAAKNAQESGTWKERAKKKMGRIFYGKAGA